MENERYKTMEPDRGNIILYKSEDGKETVDVHLADETVWLNQAQMTELFQRNKRTVSEHIRNVFKEGELEEEAVVRKFRTTAEDGKSYRTNFYNLEVIISVGYRVKSKRGTQFRIWATSILKDLLIKGYTLNQRRLAEKGILEAEQVLYLLANTLDNQNLVSDEGRQQTFAGQDLYPSIEEKAANLLYFVIKDHPFTDGHKRIGTFLFLLFLQTNRQLGEKHFDNKALVALTLLIAASEPGRKDLLIRLIFNLVSGE